MNAMRHMPTMMHDAPTGATGDRSAFAMTLLELVAAMVVITVMLGALVGVCNALANDSAQQQTLDTLRTLNKALDAYAEAHDGFPASDEPRHIDQPIKRCIATLRSSPAAGHFVADLPGLTATADHWFTVYDGFGQPMRYVNPADPSPPMAAQVQAFQRSPRLEPFVVSAGPDGRFGDVSSDDPQQRASAADNLYSFDLETNP